MKARLPQGERAFFCLFIIVAICQGNDSCSNYEFKNDSISGKNSRKAKGNFDCK